MGINDAFRLFTPQQAALAVFVILALVGLIPELVTRILL